jgi:hypothetical protein
MHTAFRCLNIFDSRRNNSVQVSLDTIEHELFTYPHYDPLESFASLGSLRKPLSRRAFQTNLKSEHK